MNPFEQVRLADTEVRVTRLGLGTAPLGGWPRAVPAGVGEATVRRAWDAGLRYFDTAPYYGSGRSEEYIGAALAGVSRSAFSISTKVGRVLEPGRPAESIYEDGLPFTPVFDFSAAGIERSMASSRKRLAMDRIDIALIHDPDDHHQAAIESAFPALAARRERGEIGAIGVGMLPCEPLARFAEEADFDCLMMIGKYTLLNQSALDELLPIALNRGISIIAGGVFNSGLLANPAPGAAYDYRPAANHVVKRALLVSQACDDFGVPVRAAALQFAFGHPAVACVVVGARTPDEVDDAVAMIQHPIPAGLWETLKGRHLLRDDAPVPR
jgi:aryl-alcohol dehydrogenase-like predicted oxidoreductase